MAFLVEIVLELLFGLLQLLAELLVQLFFEFLAELGVRSVREPVRRPRPADPLLAAIGYTIFGATAGGLSLWLFPETFIDSESLKILNVVVTPLVAGALMALLGAWRRRKDQELIRLDRFSYGYLFALAMTVVRFMWAE